MLMLGMPVAVLYGILCLVAVFVAVRMFANQQENLQSYISLGITALAGFVLVWNMKERRAVVLYIVLLLWLLSYIYLKKRA